MRSPKTPSRKEVISACAARLFRKRGYQATSMRDIAEAVDIRAASIYNHFGSKQEILSSLLLKMAHLFTQGMLLVKKSAEDPVLKLEKLVDLHVRLTVEHTDAIALIAGEWIHLEAPHLQVYRQLREAYENDFKDILEAGKTSGLLREIDTEIALFSILSTLRWLYSWYSRNQGYDQEMLAAQMKEVLLDGIKA